MKLHIPSSLVLLPVIVFIFSEIFLVSANKTKPCGITGCREDETCRLGKCIKTTEYEEECLTDPCKSGFYCNEDGKCVEDKCASVNCLHGEVCEEGLCVYNSKCATAQCFPGTYCYKGNCYSEVPCQEGQCGPAQKCYTNKDCIDPPCLNEIVCRFD